MSRLRFTKRTRDTVTDVSVWLEKLIAERPERAHLISVFGNDQEIGAIAAGLIDGAQFRVTLPESEAGRSRWARSPRFSEPPCIYQAENGRSGI